jgi:hypothetical protein
LSNTADPKDGNDLVAEEVKVERGVELEATDVIREARPSVEDLDRSGGSCHLVCEGLQRED